MQQILAIKSNTVLLFQYFSLNSLQDLFFTVIEEYIVVHLHKIRLCMHMWREERGLMAWSLLTWIGTSQHKDYVFCIMQFIQAKIKVERQLFYSFFKDRTSKVQVFLKSFEITETVTFLHLQVHLKLLLNLQLVSSCL